MADDLNRLLSQAQRAVNLSAHSDAVADDADPAWQRVEAEVLRRGKSMTWLANELGMSPAAIHMWKNRRRLPAKHYSAVAAVLRESVDWVAGLAEASERGAAPLSPMAARIAREFDTIQRGDAQLDAFTRIIGIISTARDT